MSGIERIGVDVGELVCCFFFQAEDGIRDIGVTGVQTCALPISCWNGRRPMARTAAWSSIWSGRSCPTGGENGREAGGGKREIFGGGGLFKKKKINLVLIKFSFSIIRLTIVIHSSLYLVYISSLS